MCMIECVCAQQVYLTRALTIVNTAVFKTRVAFHPGSNSVPHHYVLTSGLTVVELRSEEQTEWSISALNLGSAKIAERLWVFH